jgi:hypothetical protein
MLVLKILPLYSQYIFYVSLFVVKNKEMFKFNSETHSVCTRHKTDMYPPLLQLRKSQKGVYFCGIKMAIACLEVWRSWSHDVREFKNALKRFYLVGSFYTPECFAWESIIDRGTI